MYARRVGARRLPVPRSFRPVFSAFALVVGLGAGAPQAWADLTPPPPPQCTGGHKGDACDGAGLEPGVCQPVVCADSSRFWRVAKGADECLACVVPPDPAVNDGPGSTTTSAPVPVPPHPPDAPVARPAASGLTVRVAAAGAGVLVLAGALALLRRRRNKKP